ncbi:IS66 family insertion sequence element accessory protein TnpB [Burkholderia ubonensis]|uniref:IS66 family insertion sequence element accessory protein TnpB n=1 Tax=Burkholderia ubonensis TaxID=101571 RepID=UPI000B06B97E
MISLPTGTRIWLAAGVTDMRCGFQGLAAKVQTALEENPLGGHVFIFRGRRGDLVKLLWATDDGLWLLSKRLERGRSSGRKPMAGRSRSPSRNCRCCLRALTSGSPVERHPCR